METVKFTSISEYFEKELYAKTQQLFDEGAITENIKYKVFINAGEYFEAFTNPHQADEDRSVLVSIVNNGGLQDSSVTIDTYVQMISFEFFALEEQRENLTHVLTSFTADNKNKLINIETSAAQISISDYPEYSEMFEAQGQHKFSSFFNANMVIFTNANLSNLYVLNIDGEDILTNNLIFSRTTTLTADLQKRAATLFYPNTTGFQIQLSGIFVNSNINNTLFNDCLSNTRFNTPYTIIIKKYTDDKSSFIQLRKGLFYTKDSAFTMKFGALSMYNITFYEGLVN